MRQLTQNTLMANSQILSFICVEPRGNGTAHALFKLLTDEGLCPFVELSKKQLENRLAEYNIDRNFSTSVDEKQQVTEFKKALSEIESLVS